MTGGIDPGRWKAGFALVDGVELLFSAIVPNSAKDVLALAVKNADWGLLSEWGMEGSPDNAAGRRIDKLYVGNGTSSEEFCKILPVPYIEADEYGTTLDARKLYWRLHRPRGLARLLPLSLRTPPRNVDDLAAYAVVLRACGKNI